LNDSSVPQNSREESLKLLLVLVRDRCGLK